MDPKARPVLKGFVIQSLWDDLNALLREGRLRRETAEERLEPEDLELLDGKVEPSLWYPNATYVRLADLLAAAVGRSGDEFWVERGRRAVQRLLAEGGAVQKMVEGAKGFGDGAGRALMRLPNVVMSYGQWSFDRTGDDGWLVDVRDAATLPDSLRLSFQGAGERIAQLLSGRETRVASHRLAADHVRFEGRMR